MKSLSVILSIVAIAVAAMAFCGNPFSSTSDASLTVVAICTTMIVGINIVDRLEIREIRREMLRQCQMSDEMKVSLQSVKVAMNIMWGLVKANDKKYLSALYSFLSAFKIAIEMNDAYRASICIKQIDNLYACNSQWSEDPNKIKSIQKLLAELRPMQLAKVFENDIKKIRQTIEH